METLTVTIKQLIEGEPALRKIAQETKISGVLKLNYFRFMTAINPELEAAYKARRSLFDKYGVPDVDDDGNDILRVPDDQEEAYREEDAAILEQEISVPKFILPNSAIEALEITAVADLLLVPWLVEGVEPPKKKRPRKPKPNREKEDKS